MKNIVVLLVDDNEVDNYISDHIISHSNLAKEIITLHSAIDALDYLKEAAKSHRKFPELILLDIRMPKMDGFEFLDEFRKFDDSQIKNCSIFMLSSSLNGDDQLRAMNNPFVKKFINKPLTSEILTDITDI